MYLRPNVLTKDDENDCIADVLTRLQTRRNEDVANRIVAAGSELRKETILAVLNRRDEEVKEILLSGCSFMDGLVQVSPRVAGVWANAGSPFDPAAHKRTVDLVPTAAFRDALEGVGVRVLGTKANGAEITLITDTATGRTDGTLTAGDDIIIDGSRIKVDEADEAQGVFVVDASGAEHKVTRRLSVNKPSQLIARVPADVPPGACTVIVRTKYSTSGTSLKELRTVTAPISCTAVKG
ncbi:MAG: DUF4469 domain-containing protein [Treponema sp.]|nr:DUF4469 domain-containing protein [Treponema sp.]MBD5448514.1 DUF4469 domain-containing protein [Treponema sp.]